MQSNNKSKKKKLKGFTLIELLIVIAIIGIITSIIIVSLSSATFRSRDSKTVAQFSQIPNLLELYYTDNGTYTNICSSETSLSANSGLLNVQIELSSRGKTIECYAEDDNYCISSQLNTGEYYCVRNNSRFTALTACTSATEGCSLTAEETEEETGDIGIKLSGGYWHSLLLKEDQTLMGWGYNGSGRIGDGTEIQRDVPVFVENNIKDIDGGNWHSLAIDNDNFVLAWGNNGYGQLGDGTGTNRSTPVKVKGENNEGYLENIIDINAGENSSIALDSSGNVWTWGRNSYGKLGDGTGTNRSTPVKVKGENNEGYLENIIDISMGRYYSIALDSSGNVWSWGYNNVAQLGDGTIENKSTPVKVKGENNEGYLENIIAITAGFYNSYAIDISGNVWTWGPNYLGQLGINTWSYDHVIETYTPVKVKGENNEGYLENIVKVDIDNYHVLALDSSGNVWSWGSNLNTQMQINGLPMRKTTPVKMKDYTGLNFLENIIDIHAGYQYSSVLDSSGNVWSWGDNGYGQFGNDNNDDSHLPIQAIF